MPVLTHDVAVVVKPLGATATCVAVVTTGGAPDVARGAVPAGTLKYTLNPAVCVPE